MTHRFQTLHCHTTTSDGKLGYLEILNAAKKYGITTVAFTDHDALPNQDSLNILLENKSHPTKWIISIELSSGLPQEAGGSVHSGLHIVGLFVDPTNPDLLEHCRKAQEARIFRMKKMVKNLQNLGFNINVDDCLKASKGEAVTRPHIVEALQSKDQNLAIIEQLRIEMKKNAEKNPELKKRYNQMIQQGEQQYPYALFLCDNAYIPDVYVDYQYWVDLDTTVSLIRNAGGLAILAHYTTVQRKIPPEMLELFLRENRLDGAETVFGLWAYETDEEQDTEIARNLVRKLVKKYNKVASGGADVHKEQDLIDFANAEWFAKETTTMAERILEQTNVSTEWSSLNYRK